MNSSQFDEVADGVLYSNDDVVQIRQLDLQRLIELAQASPRRRSRICAHTNELDTLHEMLICLCIDCYIQPHRHYKPESLHWISGAADLVLFREDGEIASVVGLGAGTDQISFVRLRRPIYHTLLLHSPYLLFLETTTGPLRRDESSFASWAPRENDGQAATAYVASLRDKVGEFNRKIRRLGT